MPVHRSLNLGYSLHSGAATLPPLTLLCARTSKSTNQKPQFEHNEEYFSGISLLARARRNDVPCGAVPCRWGARESFFPAAAYTVHSVAAAARRPRPARCPRSTLAFVSTRHTRTDHTPVYNSSRRRHSSDSVSVPRCRLSCGTAAEMLRWPHTSGARGTGDWTGGPRTQRTRRTAARRRGVCPPGLLIASTT
jgi:hypothetical protein